MSTVELSLPVTQQISSPIADAVYDGLLASPKWLPAWLFYDAKGSELFEQITTLPEYYPSRTERSIFLAHADEIILASKNIGSHIGDQNLRFLELGAGSASKTGILLAAATQQQGATEYLPIDVSESALNEARAALTHALRKLVVRPQVANYVTDRLTIPAYNGPTLALYIGSSIGNFDRDDAVAVLSNLRARLRIGDSLLLGTDLVKDRGTLLAAYNDASGVTAAFNLNMLNRLNRELDADFDLAAFHHQALWNQDASRIEMHLCSTRTQVVHIKALDLRVPFAVSETIHTENSYKFTSAAIASLLRDAGFVPIKAWHDLKEWFAVTLAAAV